MIDDHNEDSGSGYWPSISDLFMTLFIVALAIMMCVFFLYQLASSDESGSGDVIVTGDGITKKSVTDPVNKLRNEVLEGEGSLRPQQSSKDIVRGLDKTSEDVVDKVAKLKKLIEESDKGPLIERIEKLEKELEETKNALAESEKKNEDYEVTIAKLESDIEKRKEELKNARGDLASAKKSDKPSIEISAEKEVFRFASGSAALDDDFRNELNKDTFVDLGKQISERNESQFKVDTIEIIGHTDGDPVTKRGNLDQILPRFLSGKDKNIKNLVAGSNNDLGLLRALAIKQAWMNYVEKKKRDDLKGIEIICFSAGQTQPLPSEDDDTKTYLKNPETYRKKEQNFRRIEIRLTRRKN